VAPKKKTTPDEARADLDMEGEAAHAPDRRRDGLNSEDEALLVKALRSGKSWDEAVLEHAQDIHPAALERWREEIEGRARAAVEKDATAAHMEAIAAREGAKLRAVASGRLRLRDGFNNDDERIILRMLRDGESTWKDVEKRFLHEIAPAALARCRAYFEEKAASPDRPYQG
jgi:hypothetical protein